MKHNILLLEVGGPASLGILKSIKASHLNCLTVGCDIDEFASGRLFSDVFIQVPPASDPTYASAIELIIDKYNIDLVIPSFHYGYKDLQKNGSPVFLTDFEKGLLCIDKYEFYLACAKSELPIPETRLLEEVESINSPAYLKPRFGVGSKNHFTVQDNEEFFAVKKYLAGKEPYVIQDFIKGEYWQTAATILKNEFISCIPFQTLRVAAGNSSVVSIKENPELVRFTKKVASSLGLSGSFNLQLFVTTKGFSIIEINPRFGSNQAFIEMAGHDVVSYLITEDPKYLQPPKPGIYMRYGEVAKLVATTEAD